MVDGRRVRALCTVVAVSLVSVSAPVLLALCGCSPAGDLGDRGAVEGYVYIPASPTVGALQDSVLDCPVVSPYAAVPPGYGPLVGARVRDVDAGLTAITDHAGHYQILGLLPGTHHLGVTHQGVVDTELTVNVYAGRRTLGSALPPVTPGQAPAYPYMGLWEVQWQTDTDAGAFYVSVDYSGNLAGGGLGSDGHPFRVIGTCSDRGEMTFDVSGSLTGTGQGRRGEGDVVSGTFSLTDPAKVMGAFQAARVVVEDSGA